MNKIFALASFVLLVAATTGALCGCSGPPDEGPDTIKTGTDTLPPAPGQGAAPQGMIDTKTGQASSGPGTMALPPGKNHSYGAPGTTK